MAAAVLTAAAAAIAGPPIASAFSPEVEAKNYSKGQERKKIYDTPAYQALLAEVSTQNEAAAAIQATDPERNFIGHVCARGDNGCAGDARLYKWQTNGYGIVKPVLFTARSGATISGHVWATKAGPSKRPGIVITNGSVQADEQLYWFAAQTLAKAGYVVLTSDPRARDSQTSRDSRPTKKKALPPRPTAAPSSTEPRMRSTSSSRHRSTPISRSQAATPARATRPSRTSA